MLSYRVLVIPNYHNFIDWDLFVIRVKIEVKLVIIVETLYQSVTITC
jgi:hypothetical protein